MTGGTHDGVQGDQRGQGQGGHAGGGGGALAVTPELLVGHQPGQGDGHRLGDREPAAPGVRGGHGRAALEGGAHGSAV
jgi:hypothetical protein